MKRVLLSCLLAAGLSQALAWGETDPFYLDILRDGIQSYEHGDFAVASRRLRVACFGMLEDPQQLAACLVRLSLAQAGANDTDGFRDTFKRLAEVQDRFGAYAKSGIPSDLRSGFETKAIALVPAGTFAATVYFSEILQRQATSQIGALAPRDRRRRLEEKVAAEPRNPVWHAMLAELEIAEDHPAPALAQADLAINLAPNDVTAVCVRGLAKANLRRCSEGLRDLEACPRSAQEAAYAGGLLGCRVELGNWSAAEEQVRLLPQGLRQDRRIAALIQKTSEHAKPATTPTKAGTERVSEKAEKTDTRPSIAHAAPPLTAQAERRVGGPPPPGQSRPAFRSSSEVADLKRARTLLDDSTSKDKELREALRLAAIVAAAHADWTDAQCLAAEAAYRNSLWVEAVGFFKKAGALSENQPDLLFYQAVSLFETGDRGGAERALRMALPRLQSSPYIDAYTKKILGDGKPAGKSQSDLL